MEMIAPRLISFHSDVMLWEGRMQFSNPIEITIVASLFGSALWLVILMFLKSRNEEKIGWASLFYAVGALYLGATSTTVTLGSITYNTPALIGCGILLVCSVIQLAYDMRFRQVKEKG
jgi:hypothetical protein